MHKLIFSKLALKQLNKLEKGIKQRIWEKIQLCKENPFRFLEHLEQINGFKLRVGDYRLIVDVNNSAKTMEILKLGHRKNIYENWKQKIYIANQSLITMIAQAKVFPHIDGGTRGKYIGAGR